MEISSTTSTVTRLVIDLTEQEAKVIAAFVQNGISGEDVEVSHFRRQIFEELNKNKPTNHTNL